MAIKVTSDTRYNLFISIDYSPYNILDIDEEQLEKLVEAFNIGKRSVFVQGRKCFLYNLDEIQIYTFKDKEIKSEQDLHDFCLHEGLYLQNSYVRWIPNDVLERFGRKVTNYFIKGDYGYLKDTKNDQVKEFFVDPNRIEEIKKINNSKLDFTKLVAFLNELNIAHSNQLTLAIPLLVRAIIDHIPPVFGKIKFDEVVNHYGAKSFKESMNILNKSSRKIADSFLHSHMRSRESLPTKTQISFQHDLDVLLQEIVRINKQPEK